MRSMTRSRYYVQCGLDERVEDWSDEAFWAELRARLDPAAAASLVTGPSIEKSIAPLRSFVPSRCVSAALPRRRRAHIVPPDRAKGLNLPPPTSRPGEGSRALREKSDAGIDGYSARCLRRSGAPSASPGGSTSLMHRFRRRVPSAARSTRRARLPGPFDRRVDRPGRELRRPAALTGRRQGPSAPAKRGRWGKTRRSPPPGLDMANDKRRLTAADFDPEVPGDEEQARQRFAQLDPAKSREDMVAAARYLEGVHGGNGRWARAASAGAARGQSPGDASARAGCGRAVLRPAPALER